MRRGIFGVFAGIAEFELDLILEPTGAGRRTAKQCGVRFGRPEKMNEEQKSLARRLLQEDKSVNEIAKNLQCPQSNNLSCKDLLYSNQ